MKKALTLRRLLLLEDNLRKYPNELRFKYRGKKFKVVWNFGSFNETRNIEISKLKERGGCGTAGCAIGRLPLIDKRFWKYDNGYPGLRSSLMLEVFDDVASYFGISVHDAVCLFGVNENFYLPIDCADGKVKKLDRRATARQVANNIRKYRKWLESQE